MQVWQRGTSSSSTGYQTVDRWSFYADSSRSISKSTDVPTGFTYSASVSGTGSTGLTQKIESVNTIGLVGQNITISFWLKQSTGAGSNAIGLNLYYATAADNWNASTQISTTQNFTTTTGWAQYSATFTNMPSGTANGLQITIVTNSGSAVAFLMTGVQLEVGSAASPFEFRSYGMELMLCQRYYTKMNLNTYTGFVGWCDSTTEFIAMVPFPVTFRTEPTFTSTGYGSVLVVRKGGSPATVNTTNLYQTSAGTQACRIYATASGLTTGDGGAIAVQDGQVGYMAWSAEL
jgi:hypothetical protein